MKIIDEGTKNKIDFILNNKDFRNFAESRMGFVSKVEVDWEKREVRLYNGIIKDPTGDGGIKFSFKDFLEFYPVLANNIKHEGDLCANSK